jgi:hypothetical protein
MDEAPEGFWEALENHPDYPTARRVFEEVLKQLDDQDVLDDIEEIIEKIAEA